MAKTPFSYPQMATRMTEQEWHSVALLGEDIGYALGWDWSATHRKQEIVQEAVKAQGRAWMQQSLLMAPFVEQADLRNVFLHNFYRAWRMAQFGGPEGCIWPGMGSQGYIDDDDYIPEQGSES